MFEIIRVGGRVLEERAHGCKNRLTITIGISDELETEAS